LAIAVVSCTVVIGTEQRGVNPSDFRFVRTVNRLYGNLVDATPRALRIPWLFESLEAWLATSMVSQIRQSEPKVYVDGQLVAPLVYGPAASMTVYVPGQGKYSIIFYRRFEVGEWRALKLTGWLEGGRIHDNLIEFRVDSKQVRIECNKPIVDADRPVFALRWQ
jgi:hypothetical protein